MRRVVENTNLWLGAAQRSEMFARQTVTTCKSDREARFFHWTAVQEATERESIEDAFPRCVVLTPPARGLAAELWQGENIYQEICRNYCHV